MVVDTKNVQGRRQVRYGSFDELLKDARGLVDGKHRTLGNWSLGQILKHVAAGMEMGIDGSVINPPWFIKIMGRLMYRKKMIHGPLPAGFQLPPDAAKILVAPAEITDQEGLEALQNAVKRLQTDSHREPSPFIGKLTREEADSAALRHAELHMSFVLPEQA